MYKFAKPFFIKVITPLHAGSGTDLGVIDLPIQRERHTDFPKIEGSGLKGSIREVFESFTSKKLIESFPDLKNRNNYNKAISLSFGPEEGDAHAGALGFTDARILLFPVKSMKGVFAYITCPLVLERFKQDVKICKKTNGIKSDFPTNNIISLKNTISNKNKLAINQNVILEEYSFKVEENEDTKKFSKWLSQITNNKEIEDRLVVLSDNDFRDFVNLSTEVITRIKIDPETGTVQHGQLFTEEYLPCETILYSLALTTPIFNEDKGIFNTNNKEEEYLVMEFFEKGIPNIIQIGGNATIGKGIVEIKLWEDSDVQ
ncbi:MAG: type III-B CRISPR module RAMP protein Cmr4 [Desulfonauticus sp.]|nr:type III-B CRISPR module RAMP protein Cmr4 [Desulfonauticus sp.]